MKKRATGFLFAALASLASANAQVVPVGGMGQHIIARNLVGIDCSTGAQTGFGTAELWFKYIAGIPQKYLFQAGATVQNETTAAITAVFSKVVLSQYQNFDMTDVFLESHAINYYYHPNSSPKDWTDFDGFQAGDLIATYQVQMNNTVRSGHWTGRQGVSSSRRWPFVSRAGWAPFPLPRKA